MIQYVFRKIDQHQQLQAIVALLLSPIGFFLFHFCSKKEIVLILSPMRSGSTLLKALLGQAPDVSHIPEARFLENRKLQNLPTFFYSFYLLAYFSAPEKIVVLKKPLWLFDDGTCYPCAPKNLNLKCVVLSRSPAAIAESILKVPSLDPRPSESDTKNYIFNAFFALSKVESNPHWQTILCSYEELVFNPIEQTRIIFEFINSMQSSGIKRYAKGNCSWNWGNDDGSLEIHSNVVQCKNLSSEAIPTRKLLALAKNSVDSTEFLAKAFKDE